MTSVTASSLQLRVRDAWKGGLLSTDPGVGGVAALGDLRCALCMSVGGQTWIFQGSVQSPLGKTQETFELVLETGQ